MKKSEEMTKLKNVFVSHHSKDEAHIRKLRSLLSKKDYKIRNSSMDSSKRRPYKLKEKTIKRYLSMRMKRASTCVVLIGKKTHTRDWVNWEIEIAKRQGKRIVGVYLYGEKETAKIPDALNRYGDSVVAWGKSENIINVIDGKENRWDTPNGNSRGNYWNGSRSNC